MMEVLLELKGFIIVIHVIVAVILIGAVLLQPGKGGGMGGLTGGGSQTIFGAGGAAPFLTKVTTVLAVLFMFTSVSLAAIYKREPFQSAVEAGDKSKQEAPVNESGPGGKAPAAAVTPESAAPQGAVPSKEDVKKAAAKESQPAKAAPVGNSPVGEEKK